MVNAAELRAVFQFQAFPFFLRLLFGALSFAYPPLAGGCSNSE